MFKFLSDLPGWQLALYGFLLLLLGLLFGSNLGVMLMCVLQVSSRPKPSPLEDPQEEVPRVV